MILKKKDLITLVQEAVTRQSRKQELTQRMQEIEHEINMLDNNSVLLKEFIGSGMELPQGEGTPEQKVAKEKESPSMYAIKPGEIYVLDFQDLDNLKISKVRLDVFRVEDPSTSQILQRGDEFKIKGSHRFEKGKEYTFELLTRIPGQEYTTNALISWTQLRG